MKCEQVIPFLSAYHDGELPDDQREAVSEHLIDCSRCQAEFASLEALSGLVRRSPAPEPPVAVTRNVERALARNSRQRWNWGNSWRWLMVPAISVAATLLIVVIWQIWPESHSSHDHRQMVTAFNRFLDNYLAGDEQAIQILPTEFHGKVVDESGATAFLKRPSVIRPTLLNKHTVKERVALKMPCCDCVQTTYSCEGTNSLVVFEHTDEQKDWYGTRPQVRTACAGKSCCLVESGKQLVATWPVDRGFVTVVGVKDVEELAALVNELKAM